MSLEGYPPDRHILRDLGIEIERSDQVGATARMAATPELAGADGGIRAGVLAVLVDLVGGAIGLRALHPDRMATADLSLQLVRPATGPVVVARSKVVRRGRTALVVEVDLGNAGGDRTDLDGTVVGWATVTFAVLPRRAADPVAGGGPAAPGPLRLTGGSLDRPVADAASITVDSDDPAQVSMPIDEYVVNSLGAAQGGVMALVAEVAGTGAVGALGEPGCSATAVDLHVDYLALGRVGPIVTRARTVTAGDGVGSAVVELVDRGAGDRLTTVVDVGVVTA